MMNKKTADQAAAACELCGHSGKALDFYPKHDVVMCPSCRLVFYHGLVDVTSIYNEAYFAGGEYFDYVADKQITQRNFKRRVRELVKLKPNGRLLELGSAYGFFLELAQEYWQVQGIDVVSAGVAYARDELDLDVIEADFLSLPDEPESYDIICMWDTIEHLGRPIRFIEKAARWLKPGGLLIITTGDIDSRMSRLQKQSWRLVHPPTHLYYFSRATLSRALQQFGLTVLDTKHIGYYRGYKSMVYELFAWGGKKSSWPYNLLTLGGRLDFPVYLNLYDIMMMIAVKSETTL